MLNKKCKHGKRFTFCEQCPGGGKSLCVHKKQKYTCRECKGSAFCEHNTQKHSCRKCKGPGICEHDRHRSNCRECNPSAFCKHDIKQYSCRECGGKGICEHNSVRNRCKDCSPKTVYKNYMWRAKKLNILFDLSFPNFLEILNMPCAYCGAQERRNGIDQIIPRGGYIKGNIAPSCAMCAYMKLDYSVSEFFSHVKKILGYQEEVMVKSIDKKPTDEKHEQNLAILERYFIGSDESGHEYVVPIARKLEFDRWSESDTEAEDFDCDKFDEFRIDGGLLTFTDPKVN
jgi:hypothetical protein